MTAAPSRPRLNLDVSLLLEPRWTGLSVFTRRLASALLADGRLELGFVSRFAQLPTHLVIEAMATGTGSYLADTLSPEVSPTLPPADPATPLLYAANKGELNGLALREASVLHDLTTLTMPETHDAWNIGLQLDHFGEELASNEAQFCISEATRATLLEVAPEVAPKTRLLPQYVDWPAEYPLVARNLDRPDLPPYAVVIGTIEPRKNLQLILDALRSPRIAGFAPHFVIVGRQGWKVADMLSNIEPRLHSRLTFTGYIGEFAKYRLLAHAEFLVFPGLCEGFGIPALEAMSLGKPVLAARAGSLPEVVGDGGLYFDPLSVDEFGSALAEMHNARRRAELSPRALARAAEFTPARMAAPVVQWVEGHASAGFFGKKKNRKFLASDYRNS